MVKHKETESESEGAPHAEEPRFRISVCMRRLFRDERARAYVCVSPRRSVHWLQRRLRRLFALPPHRLLCRAHLLPPDEPLALLERDDPVEVVPVAPDADATEPPRDVVDSVDAVAMVTEELEPSPSPVCVDDLTETKRQALLMLEQYSLRPERPRRRRVRRRRRALPPAAAERPASAASSDCSHSAAADEEPLPRSSAPNSSARNSSAPNSSAPDSFAAMFNELNAAAIVLRNDLQPRAPRVVRPLTDQMTPPRLLR